MTKTTKLAFGPGIVVQSVAFRGNRGWYRRRVTEADRVRAAAKLRDRDIAGRCDDCRSFQFRGVLRRWRFARVAGDVATSSVLERHSPKCWRSLSRPRGKHSELGNSFDCSPMPPEAVSANGC